MKEKQTGNLAEMAKTNSPEAEKLMAFPLTPSGDEIVSRRGESVKHFDLGGGRYQMVVYPEPIHFMRDGKWEEYDNTLTPATDTAGMPVLMNGDNPLRVMLAQQSTPNRPLVQLKREKRTISWSLKHMQDGCCAEVRVINEDDGPMDADVPDEAGAAQHTTAMVDSDTEHNASLRSMRKSQPSLVLYQGIQPGVDLVYTLMGNRLKEDIVIHSNEAARRIVLDLSGDYIYARDKDGSVRVLEKDGGETPFVFTAPVAFDADDRELSVETILIGSQLRYAIPENELETAVYPVTIDPVVTQKDDIVARPLKKGSTGQSEYSYPVSGRKKSGAEYATFVKANSLKDSMRRSDTVIGAYLKFKKRSGSSNYVAAYEVLSKVNTGTSNWNTFKTSEAGKPENTMLDPAMLDCKKVSGTVALDITRAYRDWKTTGKNYGILLRAPHVGVSKNTFIKLTKPQFVVNYVSHAGIAGWWQYEDQAAGRAGTAKVDLFNGNLVLEHPDMAMNGSRMPIGVAHYYNSCLSVGNAESTNPKESNDFHCGVGFKLSAQQCVSTRKAGNTWYYVWTDGTGLEHWFKKRSSGEKSNDLEGMKYELVYKKGPDKITITDTSHTVMTFVRKTTNTALWNNYWLSTVCDSIRRENNTFNKNTYTYEMPTDPSDSEQVCAYEGMISTITDSAQRMVSFVYDENLRLSRIHWNGESLGNNTFAERYLDYAYDDNGRLIGVNYYDLPEPESVESEPEPGTGSCEGGDEGEGESTVSSYHTSYEYENNLLTAAINFDGKRIQLSYDNEQIDDGHQCNCGCPYCCGSTGDTARVSAMEFLAARSDAQTLHGAKQTFEYDKLRTIVTAVTDTTSDSGKALTYLFNNSGNVVSVQDELGFAQFTEFSNQVANQVKGESKLQRVVVNRLAQFSVTGIWENTGTGNTVIGFNKTTNNIRLLGMPSAKLEPDAQIAETVTLRRGETYTASVYACTQALDNTSHAVIRVKEGNTVLASDVADVELMSVKNSGNNGPAIPDEWARMSVTFELPSGTDDAEITVELANEGSQNAWFALPQLEVGEIANHVNLLYNADFTKGYTAADGNPTFASAWKGYDKLKPNADNRVTSVPSDFPPVLDGNCLKITGNLNKSKRKVVQELPIVGGKNTVFTLGGWAKGISLPGDNGKKPYFDLAISFKQKNGKYNDKKVSYLSFNKAQQGWQYACRAVIAPYPFTAVRVECVFSQNVEYGLFSNLFLSREEFGASFAYDNDKNVVSVQNRASQKSKIKYDDARNIKAYRKPGKEEKADYTANYGKSKQKRKQHQPEWEQTPEGVRTIYGYDKFGNVISTGIQNKNHLGTSNPIIGAKKEFSEDYNGLFETKLIDARGMTVTREVDPNLGRVKKVTDPANTEVCYQYDTSDRVTEVSCQPDGEHGPVYRNTYTYENDRIATVTHNTDADETHDVTYSFDYDALGRKTTVKVGGHELSKNIYSNDRSGLLKEVQYGNGGRVRYEHDDFDRPTGVYYDDEAEPRYRYKYDAEGRIAKVIDTHLGRTAWTEYDLSGRPIRMSQMEANEDGEQQLFYRTHLNYNKDSSLKAFKETVGTGSASTKHCTSYTYDKDDRTTRVDVDSSQNGQTITYDSLGRILETNVKVANNNTLRTQFTYEDGDRTGSGYGSQATTPLIKEIKHTLNQENEEKLTYEYDDRGNITSVRRQLSGNTVEDKTTEYRYDAIGQLVRVNDTYDVTNDTPAGTTWTYQYDQGGNIVSKSRYSLVAGDGALGAAIDTIPYGYNTNTWRDRLDSYGGAPLAYDEIGNLVRFDNMAFEWSAGRQLKRMTIRGASGSGSARLSAEDGYDADSGTTLRIEFDNGNALTEDVPVSTASVHVYQDGMDVTDEFVDAAFEWQRDSGDETADAQWATDHKGVKEIQLARTEVSSDTRFSCTLKAADDNATQPVYGTVSAMPGLSATHTPAEADADHVFRVENGALVLDIPEITEENTTEPPLDIEDDDEAFDSPTIDAGDFEIVDEPDDESGDITEPDADDPEIPDDDPDVDDTPDAEYDPEAEENEPDNDDAIIIPTGINYVLEDGVLKADAGGISQDITASAMVYTGSPDTVIEFSYDRNGLRTQKKTITATGTVTTNYILHGKLVTHQTVTTEPINGTATREDLHFYYDALSRPMMVKWNGQMYRYLHNLQGDIVAIIDSAGDKVVEYRYDAWGRDIGRTLTSDIGELNPFRYRGYVYDEETGLYYLRSRYYSAEIGRFISSDEIVGSNQFTYSQNECVNHYDPDGSFAISIGVSAALIGKAILALAGSIAVGMASSQVIKRSQKTSKTRATKSFEDFIASSNATVADAIDQAMSKALSSSYTQGIDSHHIVPKAMAGAAPARAILIEGGIDPQNDLRNQIYISKQLHKHLHSDYYVSAINLAIGAVGDYCQRVYPGDKKKLENYLTYELVVIGECLKTADLIVGSGFY